MLQVFPPVLEKRERLETDDQFSMNILGNLALSWNILTPHNYKIQCCISGILYCVYCYKKSRFFFKGKQFVLRTSYWSWWKRNFQQPWVTGVHAAMEKTLKFTREKGIGVINWLITEHIGVLVTHSLSVVPARRWTCPVIEISRKE